LQLYNLLGVASDPTGLFSTMLVTWHPVFIMRMNIRAHAVASPGSNLSDDRITLTLRPAVSLPGDYSFTTNIDSVRRLLRRTDLTSTVLERFESGLWNARGASLPAVEMSEKILTLIGYFVD
jgi:hypothetical protein